MPVLRLAVQGPETTSQGRFGVDCHDQRIWGKSHGSSQTLKPSRGSSTSRKVLLITTCRRKEAGVDCQDWTKV